MKSHISNATILTLQNHNVSFAGLFGSQAKGTADKDSDYDFLVEFSPEKKYTLLDIVNLQQALEKILNSSVDVVTTKSLHPYLSESILSNLQVIYDNRS